MANVCITQFIALRRVSLVSSDLNLQCIVPRLALYIATRTQPGKNRVELGGGGHPHFARPVRIKSKMK